MIRSLFYRSPLVLVSVLTLGSVAFADVVRDRSKTVRIEIGEGSGAEKLRDADRRQHNVRAHRYYNRQLRQRVRLLEEAVQQLQYELSSLRSEQRQMQRSGSRYSCYIKTPFDGTFLGRGATLIEATAKALNQCEKKASSWCNERKVKCDAA